MLLIFCQKNWDVKLLYLFIHTESSTIIEPPCSSRNLSIFEKNDSERVTGLTAGCLMVTLQLSLKVTFKVNRSLTFVPQVAAPIFQHGFWKSRIINIRVRFDLWITVTSKVWYKIFYLLECGVKNRKNINWFSMIFTTELVTRYFAFLMSYELKRNFTSKILPYVFWRKNFRFFKIQIQS